MTVRQRVEEMFWLSAVIVALVVAFIWAKLLFGPRR